VVQAMVRDLYDRNQSARILSLNMLVTRRRRWWRR
jgi:hypothetical protein